MPPSPHSPRPSVRRRWPWALAASVLFVLSSPALVTSVLFVLHALSYQGMCGPYAPDIGVHPCDYETYLTNFFSVFALVGMLILGALTMIGSSALVTVSWLLWLLARALRRVLATSPR